MQQINLYQPMFRKERKLFSAVSMLYGCGVVLAGLLVVYGWAQWQLHRGEERAAVLQRQHDERIAQLEEMRRLYPEPAADPRLEQRIGELEERLRYRRRALETLDGRAGGNRTGFAMHLEGLARQRLPQLWLNRIVIRRGGQELMLGGSTMAPAQLPQLLKRLRGEPAFEGMTFKALRMDRSEGSERVDFTLRTEPEPREEEAG